MFNKANLGCHQLQNRIIRSATYEGMCDKNGFPTEAYEKLYTSLASEEIGALITGFTFVSNQGRAMQEHQAGIETDAKIDIYKRIVEKVKKTDTKIYMQLAHTGRQTRSKITGEPVVGVSGKKSFYFNEKPVVLTADEIYTILDQFVEAAVRAQKSGFDGIQLHAAHGYLLHQLILPALNKRSDSFKVDSHWKIGIHHLDYLIDEIHNKCTEQFTILLKVSSGDDYCRTFKKESFVNLIEFLDTKPIDGIEVSYGTMDYAFSIFRGNSPIETAFKVNPLLRDKKFIEKTIWKHVLSHFVKYKIKRFIPTYNLDSALLAKAHTSIPIICVGGFRTAEHINHALEKGIDFVSMCRPFIAEPDLISNIKKDNSHVSKCINCNLCAVMCDSGKPTQCYRTGVRT
jgi:2,4-dienoyl-CoA reductase-like NADH-dependent reductase (Old Yellow Enzyme family)